MTKWNEPDDIRAEDGAGEYPNYTITKTPSGHTIMMDDTEGYESFTIQHRTGSMIQMRPDGTVHLRTNGDKYDVVLGENRVKITGSHDLVIDGAASMLVQGNYDMTVNGDMNTVVQGNHKTQVGGSQEISVLGDQTTTVNGNQNQAVLSNRETIVSGTDVKAADGGISMEATGGGLFMKSADQMGIESSSGLTMLASDNIEANATEIRLNS